MADCRSHEMAVAGGSGVALAVNTVAGGAEAALTAGTVAAAESTSAAGRSRAVRPEVAHLAVASPAAGVGMLRPAGT